MKEAYGIESRHLRDIHIIVMLAWQIMHVGDTRTHAH